MKFTLVVDETAEESVVATVHRESGFTVQMENLVLHYTGGDRLAAYTEDELKMLPFAQIECITLLGGKTYAIDREGEKYLLRHRLYELEQLLPANFIRINKSSLANQDRLDRLSASFNGAVDAVFKCGYRDYVSRRCFGELKRRLTGK